jgi:SAM-dependent methyltransferase
MLAQSNIKLSRDTDLTLKIAREFGFLLKPDSRILDFGCGSGKSVYELCHNGYQAFGCDIKIDFDSNDNSKSLIGEGKIKPIDLNPYRLPFEDQTFDFIFSNQVFEHVQNYSESISEIARILKPDGICLHILPSRYRPIEPHVYVPFSSVLRSYGWLYFWALLGIRNEFQKDMNVKERTTNNYHYLRDRTKYLSKKDLRKYFKEQFNQVLFCEREFLKFTRRGNLLYNISKVIPFLPNIYSTFRMRVIVTRSPSVTFNQGA